MDDSGSISVSYDNDETFYRVGLGVSVQTFAHTIFYAEAEQLFGDNYTDSYIFSLGVRHSF